MNLRITLLVLTLMIVASINCFSQNNSWEWGISASGAGIMTNYGGRTCVDNAGNVYMSGSFRDSSLTIGSLTVVNSDPTGATYDGFLLKMDAWRNVIWLKSYGGSGNDYGEKVISLLSGNFLVVGTFLSPTMFTGNAAISNAGINDLFIARFDPNGNLLDAEVIGSSGGDWYGTAIQDKSGAIIFTGIFEGPSLTFRNQSITNSAYQTLFVIRFWEDGRMSWLHKVTQSQGVVLPRGMDVDGSGNIYIGGNSWTPSLTFESTTIISNGETDFFIIKYDSACSMQWVNSFGGPDEDEVNGLRVDTAGSLYITGDFQSWNVSLGSTSFTNSDGGGQWHDGFIAKFDLNCNAIWAKTISGPLSSDQSAGSLCVDNIGHTYFSAYVCSTGVYFQGDTIPNPGCLNFNSLYKLDMAGNVLCDAAMNSEGASLTADNVGNVYVSGSFRTTQLIFGSDILSWYGGERFYLAKFNCTPTAGLIEETRDDQLLYPNPSNGIFTVLLDSQDPVSMEVFNSAGQTVFVTNEYYAGMLIDLSKEPVGLYTFNIIRADAMIISQRIIIAR